MPIIKGQELELQLAVKQYVEHFSHPVPMDSLSRPDLMSVLNKAVETNTPVKGWEKGQGLYGGSLK
ncbi:hypothetical protein [Solemya velum gill symbiont]|uniref:hypothetical protein n=1 Tax=Solemya velum gill symbiont TaxID=2340 RepID=UPI0009988091|nr:hypothetical protein [Solemya velum gill symbiont]OOZ44256.1 hypothetical protein BOW37_07705 [Solemya velum gill symbiont]OOZ48021.1 hypothetical protein BOW38_00730 [Solemya velum gill symbiont]OOZ51044.1 hypothetical protein BOW39_00015 [Solemya velum gill symbiont]OOZ52963.1 hypothetical protein BOW40_00730 [Solemya velum gill symbiont]OOZ55604.1 hypothetical protein BOW42_09550 [Solemya velum gill symbiont]